MARRELPSGRYRIEVDLFGASRRRVGFLSLPEVQIRSGRGVILNQWVR